MKQAWEWDYEMFSGAVPVKDRTDLIQWDNLLEGKFLEEARQMLESGKGAWTKPLPSRRRPTPRCSARSAAWRTWATTSPRRTSSSRWRSTRSGRIASSTCRSSNARVFKALAAAPKIAGHPYWSCVVYESFEQYLQNAQLCEYPDYRLPGREELFDRVHAGWLGEIIGSALGTAVEGFKSSRLWEVFGEIDGYVKPPETLNDDITFELALLEAFREKGYAIDSDDIADKWVGLIPFAYTAEEVALRHMRSGIYPPQSGYLVNPYREMIGAAMRAAICGALAPGRPRLAAELAWKDGRVSHHNNGILAEVFNAVLVSMAYVETDMRTVLEKAMRAIPMDSEFYTVLEFAFEACEKSATYREAWELCEEKYKHYNWVHCYPNMASEVIAIYFAGNDYQKAMSILMMSGQDNDCTGGPIGHAYGAMLGTAALDKKFTEPLEDRLDTYVRTMETQSITSLSEKTTDAILKHWQE